MLFGVTSTMPDLQIGSAWIQVLQPDTVVLQPALNDYFVRASDYGPEIVFSNSMNDNVVNGTADTSAATWPYKH